MTMPIIGVVLAILAVVLVLRARHGGDEYPPLQTAPDDPLLLDAMRLARERVPQFRALLAQPREHALVKLGFTSSAGTVEHLWAEVRGAVEPDLLDVHLVTLPVSHAGHLARDQRCPIDTIEDWQVRTADGRIHGGFTQRAMFAIARRDGITLPPALAAQAHLYGDVPA